MAISSRSIQLTRRLFLGIDRIAAASARPPFEQILTLLIPGDKSAVGAPSDACAGTTVLTVVQGQR
jgi:hypothetical protein